MLQPFTWIVEQQVGACPYPEAASDWETLRLERAALLINLHPRRHDPSALAERGLEELHLPVTDFTPPTQEQLEAGVAAITHAVAAGRRVVVHCAAGLGRTGTLMACYLVTQGYEPDAAIQRLRELRKGSVETPDQEQAIREFATRHASSRHAS